MDPNLKTALEIAKNELRACYTESGILAGRHHFTDYWARDGFFACFGALAIGDREIVQKQVELFFSFQRKDGLIPYRIMNGPVNMDKYLGKPSFYESPKPTYKLRGWGKEVYDGTTMAILFAAILGLEGRNETNSLRDQIAKALIYLQSKERNGLLFDGVMAEWNDSALKWGNLLYSNIIYWYMYCRLAAWANTFDSNWALDLSAKKTKIAAALRLRLWNGRFFADWYDYKRQDYFYSFGNCLAIAWGFTTKEESEKILNECRRIKVKFTLETNYPEYPWWRIDPLQRLTGMGDYQNESTLWWQPVTAYLKALKKLGISEEFKTISRTIIKKINLDTKIFECYERDGKPVMRFYRSEQPASWSAGSVLWALSTE